MPLSDTRNQMGRESGYAFPHSAKPNIKMGSRESA